MLGYERPLTWTWSSGDCGGWEKPSLSASGGGTAVAGELEADSRKDFPSVRNEALRLQGVVQGAISKGGSPAWVNAYHPVRLRCHPAWRQGEGPATFQALVL